MCCNFAEFIYLSLRTFPPCCDAGKISDFEQENISHCNNREASTRDMTSGGCFMVSSTKLVDEFQCEF